MSVTEMKGKEKYPNLFSPVNIGGVTLRNRVVMAAMGMSR